MPRPLASVWNHYRLLDTSDKKKHVACMYCSQEYKTGNATRMRTHILQYCKSCPNDVKQELLSFKSEQSDDEEEVIREREPRTIIKNESVFVDNEEDITNETIIENERGTTASLIDSQDNPYDHGTQTINIDEALSRAMYATGASLSLLESRYWKAALEEANIHVPTRDALNNSLLTAEYSRVKTHVLNKLQISQALGLIVDGWSNDNSQGVVNFILTTPEPVFYKSVYPESERETADCVSQHILKVLREVDSSKFVTVVTDNGPVMKLVWRKISNKYPHISCVACVSHTLNLLCSDILDIMVIKNTSNMLFNIVQQIKGNQVLLTHFEKTRIAKYGSIKCTLKLPCKNNWNSGIMVFEYIKSNEEALKIVAESNAAAMDRNIRDYILSDDLWTKVEEISSILQPISEALQESESDKLVLSDIPALFSKLTAAIEGKLTIYNFFTLEEKGFIRNAVKKRRESCVMPVHLAANLLDPRYRGEHLCDDLPIATEFISQYAGHIYENTDVTIPQLLSNVASFKTKTGYFGKSSSIWMPVQKLLPSIWWRTFAPNEIIAKIAIRLLSAPASCTASQRIWNSFASSLTAKWNRLRDKNYEKLLFVRSNLYFMGNEYEDETQPEDGNVLNDSDSVTSRSSLRFDATSQTLSVTLADINALKDV